MAGNSLERVTGTLSPAEASGTSSASLKLESVSVPLLPETNVIIGQSHFIKTVEDIYEAISGVGGGIKFGLAFSEASGES
jgi:adenosine/AMP kinase